MNRRAFTLTALFAPLLALVKGKQVDADDLGIPDHDYSNCKLHGVLLSHEEGNLNHLCACGEHEIPSFQGVPLEPFGDLEKGDSHSQDYCTSEHGCWATNGLLSTQQATYTPKA